MIVAAGHIEPVPRRIRAWLGGAVVLDTTSARYVWEWPPYPQYYVPRTDLAPGVLVDEQRTEHVRGATVYRYGLRAGGLERPGAALVYPDTETSTAAADSPTESLAGLVRLDWAALDAWFEEDEQVFVHPRNPYVRVDALRSHRAVRVDLDGVVLAESTCPVMLFETGLPTRYYFDRADVRLEQLQHSETETACPYKGVTTDYWSVRTNGTVEDGNRDLAWSYQFPTASLTPIAGLIAFYNEKVDVFVDGVFQGRPRTHLVR